LGEREKYRQKRRRPRPARDPGEPLYSKFIEDVSDLIPEAGEGYRWYDYP
jgi:hypothetical protein